MLSRLINAVAYLAELALTRRALGAMFIAAVASTAFMGWLRPPLSRDLTAMQIPLGIWSSETVAEASDLLQHRRQSMSVGSLILITAAIGLALVLWKPRWLTAVAGVLLAVAICANAIVLVNHPLLIESLDSELSQRQHMATMITEQNENSVTMIGQARIPPVTSENKAHLMRGWPYLRYGTLLLTITIAGVLLAQSGPLPHRIYRATAFGFLSVVFSVACCSQRLLAEWHWSQTAANEMIGKLEPARDELARAISIMPQFADLERTWLLTGRIDLADGVNSDAVRFLRAERYAHAADWPAALDESKYLLASSSDSLPVRRQAAKLYVMDGLTDYRFGRLTAAHDDWQRAHDLDSARLDVACYLALTQSKLDTKHPEQTQAWVDFALSRLADRLLRADLLATLGDAYFEAGQYAEARTHYKASLKVYDLPKEINYRGRRGLLGM